MTTTQDGKTVTLSAPWYQLQRVISYSIGQSAQVTVSQLDNNYQMTVTTQLEATATALANTIKTKHELGNITVEITVKDIAGNTYLPVEGPMSTADLIDNLKRALVNNPLVFAIEEFGGKAAIDCMAEVVQFFNDDISNPSKFTSMMAADAFRQVFIDDVVVYTLGKAIGNF